MSNVSEFIKSRMQEKSWNENREVFENVDECLDDICNDVEEKFNTQCSYTNCGGFDSPGYDISCFAIAFIDETGELGLLSYEEECY